MKRTNPAVEFTEVVLRNVPTATDEEISELLTIAKRMHRRNEADCNFGLTPRQQANDRRDEARVKAILATWGGTVKPRFNGDPRGFSLYFLFPDESYNSWGGKESGYGI